MDQSTTKNTSPIKIILIVLACIFIPIIIAVAALFAVLFKVADDSACEENIAKHDRIVKDYLSTEYSEETYSASQGYCSYMDNRTVYDVRIDGAKYKIVVIDGEIIIDEVSQYLAGKILNERILNNLTYRGVDLPDFEARNIKIDAVVYNGSSLQSWESATIDKSNLFNERITNASQISKYSSEIRITIPNTENYDDEMWVYEYLKEYKNYSSARDRLPFIVEVQHDKSRGNKRYLLNLYFKPELIDSESAAELFEYFQ